MTQKTQTFIDLSLADGLCRFWLPYPQCNELETLCGCGIGRVIGKVLQGRPLLDSAAGLIPFGDPMMAEFDTRHIVETIRMALIGGNRCVVNGVEPRRGTIRLRGRLERHNRSGELA